MIKLLVYTDGKEASAPALHFAAELKKRLPAELAIITVRRSTHATEEPTPIGEIIPLENRESLTEGIQILTGAVDVLTAEGLLDRQEEITIRDVPNGHLFVCK